MYHGGFDLAEQIVDIGTGDAPAPDKSDDVFSEIQVFSPGTSVHRQLLLRDAPEGVDGTVEKAGHVLDYENVGIK